MADLDLREYCVGVEAGEGWREWFEVESRLSKLPSSGWRIPAFHMQESNGHFDQRVVEEAERVGGIAPKVLQRLVGVPETSFTQVFQAGAQCQGELVVIDVRGTLTLEPTEPKGILLGARECHGATS